VAPVNHLEALPYQSIPSLVDKFESVSLQASCSL